jgi:hypothetical protein
LSRRAIHFKLIVVSWRSRHAIATFPGVPLAPPIKIRFLPIPAPQLPLHYPLVRRRRMPHVATGTTDSTALLLVVLTQWTAVLRIVTDVVGFPGMVAPIAERATVAKSSARIDSMIEAPGGQQSALRSHLVIWTFGHIGIVGEDRCWLHSVVARALRIEHRTIWRALSRHRSGERTQGHFPQPIVQMTRFDPNAFAETIPIVFEPLQ